MPTLLFKYIIIGNTGQSLQAKICSPCEVFPPSYCCRLVRLTYIQVSNCRRLHTAVPCTGICVSHSVAGTSIFQLFKSAHGEYPAACKLVVFRSTVKDVLQNMSTQS